MLSQTTILGAVLCFGIAFASLVVTPVVCRGDDDAVEEVEDVEVVTPDVSNIGQDAFTLSKVIGRNHPALVHIPIGMLIALLLVELVPIIRPGLDMGKAGLLLSPFTALSFIPAAVSGLIRAQEVFADREPSPLLLEHRNLMIAAFSAILAASVICFVKRAGLKGTLRLVYLALIVVSLILVGLGGHHGGQLVYGEDYLPY